MSFAGLLRSEFRKLATRRSTWVLVGLSLLTGLVAAKVDILVTEYTPGPLQPLEGYNITRVSQTLMEGPIFPGLFMAVLGIMAITNEYSSGTIRATLAMTPARWPVLTAKAVLVGAFAFVTTLAGVLLGAVWAWRSSAGTLEFDLFTPMGLHVWIGGAIAVLMLSLMGLATGTLLRSTALSVLTLLLVMLVLPIIILLVAVNSGSSNVFMISFQWFLRLPPGAAPAAYMNSAAGAVAAAFWQAVAAMLAWTLIPLAGAYVRFQLSD